MFDYLNVIRCFKKRHNRMRMRMTGKPLMIDFW